MNKAEAAELPVGIDLGTTFSVVATLDARGRPRTIQNAEGDVTTPSVVMFDRATVVVGKEAVKLASYEPEAIAAYAKRDIGASASARRSAATICRRRSCNRSCCGS